MAAVFRPRSSSLLSALHHGTYRPLHHCTPQQYVRDTTRCLPRGDGWRWSCQ
ncbi:hypothetical protein E2C01_102563 [Portunus trituberculatus]|uniref:Uncharacterized protein n=1 Tax=Portunus trituberculatus TaxID=210409 RepID=A0A5B7KMW8_PORTR|nr:hypothetical protein [Portunus trituberculatus]